jgi:hypothetical protein
MAGLMPTVDDLLQIVLAEARNSPMRRSGHDRPESPGFHRFLKRENGQRQGTAVALRRGEQVGILEQARSISRRGHSTDLCFAFVREALRHLEHHLFPKKDAQVCAAQRSGPSGGWRTD